MDQYLASEKGAREEKALFETEEAGEKERESKTDRETERHIDRDRFLVFKVQSTATIASIVKSEVKV